MISWPFSFNFSAYAHYYDDEEDGWDMPNFYSEGGYMKDPKMNSLARSSASLYGNKEELYDRLRRHAYHGQGKKGECSEELASFIFNRDCKSV